MVGAHTHTQTQALTNAAHRVTPQQIYCVLFVLRSVCTLFDNRDDFARYHNKYQH